MSHKTNILIGCAWPYANGPLHIGHIAALLPGDVIARYYRMRGCEVYFVSGSDCHGTPVAIRAAKEGLPPEAVSDRFHEQFERCFERLGFSFDRYGKTSSDEHIEFVKKFHEKMYGGGYVYEKEVPQAFCERCARALADRFVAGVCPECGGHARGDQCEACGAVTEPENLVRPVCAVCGETPAFKLSKHLFLAVSRMTETIRAMLDSNPHWRKNAIAFTRRYLDEGLRDRALTRDLDWGIDVPKDGYENKKIYIWAENVLGYLSMSRCAALERGGDYTALWGGCSRHYYVHGKDNIPFHTIILPALMTANGGKWHFPDHIISSEYMTLEGKKISTSGNWAVWAEEAADEFGADPLRYYLIANGPEKRDTDFSRREFIRRHNGELLGAYGNFVNRVLSFVYKYMDAKVPDGSENRDFLDSVEAAFPAVGELIESGSLKEAIDTVFELVRSGNKFFDSEKPWETRLNDESRCRDTIFTCVQAIASFTALLEPFLPFSSQKAAGWLSLSGGWEVRRVKPGTAVPEPEILFKRYE